MSLHDLQIIIDEGKPEERVLKATVNVDWSYETNPGDKEGPHYHGEDDGPTISDWSIVGEVEINGAFLTPKELDAPTFLLIEGEVENLSFD